MSDEPADFLRRAREGAGLSQRALAERAGTSQSVVARIESRATSPTWETLTRLVAAAGFELDARLRVRPTPSSHMLGDVARIRKLSPEARLAETANLSRFMRAVRRD